MSGVAVWKGEVKQSAVIHYVLCFLVVLMSTTDGLVPSGFAMALLSDDRRWSFGGLRFALGWWCALGVGTRWV